MTTGFTTLNTMTAVSPNTRLKASQFQPIRLPTLVDGVLEGGGALGTAYAGALRNLHDHGIWFARIAGNSAGAITAAMIAVGFTAPEIQWLCSAYTPAPSAPSSLTQTRITAPIPFASFLDLPTLGTLDQASKRKTLLWKYLKGQIIDEIGRIPLPVPVQGDTVNDCLQAILNSPVGPAIRGANLVGLRGDDVVRQALDLALAPLPDHRLQVKDFLPNTTQLREQFADTVWDAIARNSPMLLLTTNLLHEGSIFEGDVFLKTIRELFGKKFHNNPTATVLFQDLKIPLAVIAADIDTGEMIVYNSKDHPNMEVAVAVRQSMSIPFVFQPQGPGRQIVDGGLFSNFPAWLFTAGGKEYWEAKYIDDNRLKIGLSLNETKDAVPGWNVKPPRFQIIRPQKGKTTPPPHIDKNQVLKPILAEKFAELGIPQATVDSEFDLPDWEIIQEINGVVSRGVLNTEAASRQQILAGLMAGKKYIDVEIPLLGYDGLDFGVNEDESALFAMWDRAWHVTMDALTKAKNDQIMPTGFLLANNDSPYN